MKNANMAYICNTKVRKFAFGTALPLLDSILKNISDQLIKNFFFQRNTLGKGRSMDWFIVVYISSAICDWF